MKRTGPKYFRYAGTPNIRRQDGVREMLLCEACEDLFSRDERLFAKLIFRPVIADPAKSFSYDEYLMRFLLSVAWRVMTSRVYSGSRTTEFTKELAEAEEEWLEYLVGGSDLARFNRVHIFVTDIVADGVQPVQGLTSYMARAVDATIAESGSLCAVYAKIPRFMIWAEITEFDQTLWRNTRVIKGSGIIRQPQSLADGRIGDFLLKRASGASDLYWRSISERQQGVISERFVTDAPYLQGTDFWRALEADMEAEVDPQTWRGSKIGRNERSPCGSGEKYKHCHGK
jgi:SEC-C motif